MNTTKAIIILVLFIIGLVVGYRHFVINVPVDEKFYDVNIIDDKNQTVEGDMYYEVDPITGNPVIVIPPVITIPSRDTSPQNEQVNVEGKACADVGGTWSIEFQECLGITGESCAEIGGNWNDCASACRNNPNAEFCTMQCVQVCDFKGNVISTQY